MWVRVIVCTGCNVCVGFLPFANWTGKTLEFQASRSDRIPASRSDRIPRFYRILKLGEFYRILNYLYLKNLYKSRDLTLGINPGGTYGSAKRWYPDEFAEVAAKLSKKYNIIIIGGSGEKDIATDIEKLLIKKGVSNYQNLAGNTTISELVGHISNLDLFITGDSGPMHIAAAFQVPTVAIFGPTKTQETSQWMNKKSLIVKKDLDCQPCMKRVCPLKHHNCMKYIKSVDVLSATKSLN